MKSVHKKMSRFLNDNLTIATVLRVVVSAVFAVSAISKLLSVDSFEIFVFSLQYFNLNVSFILARLVISFELFLAVMILISAYNKPILILSISTLAGFTLFLLFRQIAGAESHCFCFGDLIELSNNQSIIKNIILIALLVFLFRDKKSRILNKAIVPSVAIIALISPFIVSPPDIFCLKSKANQHNKYNNESLTNYLESHAGSSGYRIICFMSTTCNYCKLAMRKLDIIVSKTSQNNMVLVNHWGDKNAIFNFYKELDVFEYNAVSLSPSELIKISNGKIPLILLLDQGKVIKSYGYRDMDENVIQNHLRKK